MSWGYRVSTDAGYWWVDLVAGNSFDSWLASAISRTKGTGRHIACPGTRRRLLLPRWLVSQCLGSEAAAALAWTVLCLHTGAACYGALYALALFLLSGGGGLGAV